MGAQYVDYLERTVERQASQIARIQMVISGHANDIADGVDLSGMEAKLRELGASDEDIKDAVSGTHLQIYEITREALRPVYERLCAGLVSERDRLRAAALAKLTPEERALFE